ncbi:hypothetical protein K458DRAFT_398703 [Lentithecium fluviatile CBS 122367]|uniref:C2H2-type domain-containing protein n=1 Tax=Lentithecium fluviatile CBS 122367 TaxID=1168545 RepID=A0A6G1JJP2_9PLEO|nr:hypothetical protein K458DRAFT_398703 [Lentithecium fluviatile CBS 122367]
MDPPFAGAHPPFSFEGAMTQENEFDMSPPGAYSDTLQAQHNLHGQPFYAEQNSYGFPLHVPEQHPAMGFAYQTQHSHQRHLSTSTQSTHSSAFRSSDGSTFSQWHPRSSVASTNTTWSQFSNSSREQHIAQTESALDPRFAYTSPPLPTPVEEPIMSPSKKGMSHRRPTQEKEPFRTCASRTKRSRDSQKQPRYECTSCGEGFQQKFDWKRHEETYQERNKKYECNLCTNVYFLEKDFVLHHQNSHRCKICADKKHVGEHVDLARKPRQARTGWGCGFCIHFSAEWTERCNHISRHFEAGERMASWKHSKVILSLLKRPEIISEVHRLLETKQRAGSLFFWKPESTGRVEGYPEANIQPQLQDLLEYYTPNKSPADIVRLAFQKGFREKALPRPPVPEKDYAPEHAHGYIMRPPTQHAIPRPPALQNSMDEVPSWDRLSMIPEDPNLPTYGCDDSAVHAAFNNIPGDFHPF